jgi:membrane-associated phospholipid phosphatase
VKRQTVFYWITGIAFIAILVGAAFYFDGAVRDFIARHQSPPMRSLMRTVSRFGDWPEHFALGLFLLGFAWWRGNQNWKRVFLSMLAAIAIAGLIGHVIKITAGRARPSVKTEQVWNGFRLSSKYHAFPSGHVVASSAFFAVLFFANRRIGLACAPIPIVIGFSRMCVAAHYLSDVVFGIILGVVCATVVARALKVTRDGPQGIE